MELCSVKTCVGEVIECPERGWSYGLCYECYEKKLKYCREYRRGYYAKNKDWILEKQRVRRSEEKELSCG